MLNFLKLLASVFTKHVPSNSGAGEVNAVDWVKLLRGALFAGIGAVVAFFQEHITGLDLGAYTAFIVPAVAAALEWVTRWLKDNKVD